MAVVRFTGRGHPNVRATHTKTLELSVDVDITARATCVLAVAACARPSAPLAGPVRITITAGALRFSLLARANPQWDPAGPAVIRRSPLRLPGTLATHADAASSDLPRELVDILRDPDTSVDVLVEPVPTERSTIVLFAADPTLPDDPALRAELEAADAVVAEDPVARRLAPPRGDPRGRILVVATADLPGASVRTELARADVETVGLPARLAAAAATPGDGPLTIAPPGADPLALLRIAPAAHRLLLTVGFRDLDAVLAAADSTRGPAVLVQEFAAPVRRPADLATRDTVHVGFAAASGDLALDPAVQRAMVGLLADGVPTKTAAAALAALTGWPRRRAYDAVLELAARTKP